MLLFLMCLIVYNCNEGESSIVFDLLSFTFSRHAKDSTFLLLIQVSQQRLVSASNLSISFHLIQVKA